MKSTTNKKDIKNSIWIIYSTAKKVSLREIEKLLDSSDGSGQKECCGTAPTNREAVSINTAQLYIKIHINRKMRSVIIDSNIIGNFIIKKYTENKKHFI